MTQVHGGGRPFRAAGTGRRVRLRVACLVAAGAIVTTAGCSAVPPDAGAGHSTGAPITAMAVAVASSVPSAAAAPIREAATRISVIATVPGSTTGSLAPTGAASAGTGDPLAPTSRPPVAPSRPPAPTTASPASGGPSTAPRQQDSTTIAPRPATSSLQIDDAPAASYGSPVTLSFQLLSGGVPLEGARTEVSHAGKDSSVTVDSRGRGSIRLAGLPVGKSAVTVRYPGDAGHRPASATVTLPVGRASSEIRSLTVAGSTVLGDQNIVAPIGAAVTVAFDVYSAGKPVAGAKGSVVYGGTVTEVTLDAHGHATASLEDLPAGAHRLLVRYPGDRNREGAGAPLTVTVTNPDAKPAAGAASGSGSVAHHPCPATARACVDLTTDTSWLQSGGTITYGPVPITSGRPGYRTPAGTFRVYWKDKDHRSSLFNGAPMPNSVFFVGGIAFHQGSLSAPSHGCIHLSWDASQAYWDHLRNGDAVFVFGYAPY